MVEDNKFVEFKSNVRIKNLNRIVNVCDFNYPDTVDWLKSDGEKIVYMALQHTAQIERNKKINEDLLKGRVPKTIP